MLISGYESDRRARAASATASSRSPLRLFGGRASHARSPIEGRQPEPSSSVACGSRWNGPGGGGEDWRHGSPDVARLGSSLQRFGAGGLIDNRTEGRKPRLSEEQLAQSAKIVEAGPDREKDGIVRWRRVDLKRVIAERLASAKSRRKPDRPRSGLQRVQPVIITFSKCFLILGP